MTKYFRTGNENNNFESPAVSPEIPLLAHMRAYNLFSYPRAESTGPTSSNMTPAPREQLISFFFLSHQRFLWEE